MEKQQGLTEKKVTFNVDKAKNFSKWLTEIIQKAELSDLRYNVKGFVVFQPWSVLSMEAMYDFYEAAMQRKGHKPYWYPALIPESNFKLESDHVQGFTPEVFWVTEYGDGQKLEERYAMRPTSETAMYQMFSIWIRSYNDLPFKTYQRAQVWRRETKATRPFLRGREFYWIESHNAFATEEEAIKQVHEDMDIAEEVLHGVFGVPFIFFERPQWDKFCGAEKTFAADTITPDGKIIQQPSTHLLGQKFTKAFDVKFVDKDNKEKFCYTTCYGPAISRMFASVIATHGDNNGLRFPFEIAPLQLIIVPIAAEKDAAVIEKARKLAEKLREKGYRVEADLSDRKPGDKFYFWEMKGVPLRIELGPKELAGKKLTIYRRDTGKKTKINEKDLFSFTAKAGKEISKNIKAEADKGFKGIIKDADSLKELKKVLNSKGLARANFCSIELKGEKCAEVIEKELQASVRGKKIDMEEKPFGSKKCVVCGKPAETVVYIGRAY
jgi:prolyl-tRNA synthetase